MLDFNMTYKQAFFALMIMAVIFGQVRAVEQSRSPRHLLPNRKFTECEAGKELAVKVGKKYARSEGGNVYSFERDNGQQRFYICRVCSMCGDGVRESVHCHEDMDIQCGGCINPDYEFDQATKSCQPMAVIMGLEDNVPDVITPKETASSQELHDDKETQRPGGKSEVLTRDDGDKSDQFDNARKDNLSWKGGKDAGTGNVPTKEDSGKTTEIVVIVVSIFSIVATLTAIVVVVVRCRRSAENEPAAVEV